MDDRKVNVRVVHGEGGINLLEDGLVLFSVEGDPSDSVLEIAEGCIDLPAFEREPYRKVFYDKKIFI